MLTRDTIYSNILVQVITKVNSNICKNIRINVDFIDFFYRSIYDMKGTRLMLVNGISVTVTGLEDMSKKEIIGYIQMLQQENNGDLAKLSISPAEDGEINLDYELQPAKFERIRRITGYLVGTIDRWNNAKKAEEHDRVKHAVIN